MPDNNHPSYQHKRSLSVGTNGEGQPLAHQIAEGEIAINLTSRQLYTKRPLTRNTSAITTGSYTWVVASESDTSAVYYKIFETVHDSENTARIGSVDLDTTSVSSVVADLNAIDTDMNRIDTSNSGFTGIAVFGAGAPDSEFNRQVIHGSEPLVRINLSADVIDAARATYVGQALVFFSTPSHSATPIAVASGIVAEYGRAADGLSEVLYMRSFRGTIDTENTTYVRADSDLSDYEVIRLNNVPYISDTRPTHLTTTGDMWYDTSGLAPVIRMLDTTLIDDSDAQVTIRMFADPPFNLDLESVGIFVYDSDGQPHWTDSEGVHDYLVRYAEWRNVSGESILGAAVSRARAGSTAGVIHYRPQTFNSMVTFNDDVTMNRDLRVAGDVTIDNSLTVGGPATFNGGVTIPQGQTFTFWSETDSEMLAFDRTRKFTIRDSNGAQVFSLWGFDTDDDLTN